MQQISVTSLVRYLKNKIDTDYNLQNILISGEISNFHLHSSGHLYFTLKDQKSAISCVMFKSSASTLSFIPKNGDKVILKASTSIFETAGQLQLYVSSIKLDGLGELYAQYEFLKSKLLSEGYFDEKHKINISTQYPCKIAVLVGENSAAMSDIKTTFARRWPLCNVTYYPVLVQGSEAPSMIIKTLKDVDNMEYDAIILARGGGSFEDLFCFNDEELVKCIYDLKTFIITGIGHEQDYSLCDFVADRRAATPTASVELITPNILDLKIHIDELNKKLRTDFEYYFNDTLRLYDYYFKQLSNYQITLHNLYNDVDNKLMVLNKSLNLRLLNTSSFVENSIIKMRLLSKNMISKKQLEFKRLNTLLNAYSLENSLKRGYTLVFQNGELVKEKNALKDELFVVRFVDGDVNARKDEDHGEH